MGGGASNMFGGDEAAQVAQFKALKAAYEAKRGEELSDEAMVEYLKTAVPSLPAAEAAPSGARVVIAGPPAGGKGTQCEYIREFFGSVHLSTGDMLRAAVAAGTAVGEAAKTHMDAGGLVPDDVMIGVISERLQADDCAARGWLLDGFPRSHGQAEAMTATLQQPPHVVVVLEVPDDAIVARVAGRRSDPETGKIYHLEFNPPESEEIAARLTQRSDDTEEAIRTRLATYQENLGKIVSHLTEAFGEGIVVRVDGNRAKDEIWPEVKAAIETAVSAPAASAPASEEAAAPAASEEAAAPAASEEAAAPAASEEAAAPAAEEEAAAPAASEEAAAPAAEEAAPAASEEAAEAAAAAE